MSKSFIAAQLFILSILSKMFSISMNKTNTDILKIIQQYNTQCTSICGATRSLQCKTTILPPQSVINDIADLV